VLPAALAANWLAAAWDQNAAHRVMSPVAAHIEDIVLRWLVELLDLPSSTGGGLVTGATMANFTALAAARHALLRRVGWEVEENGLFGASPIQVVLGAEAHVSIRKALSMLGLGRGRVIEVPTDGQGRMRADALPVLNDLTIVCIQAGNVSTGAFDPASEICSRAEKANAWVHVDGAFGLWAAVAPARKHLLAGFREANSWATDGHKWLNVPYDSGIALVREPKHVVEALTVDASYYQLSAEREPCHYTPELSRRARGIELPTPAENKQVADS
jgi:glutamate/tyrosine decarboxylase-like PLP-dependent enzyme